MKTYKSERREKQRNKRKYGMKVSGRGIRKLANDWITKGKKWGGN